MSSLLVIGECMMELCAQNETSFSRAFAGDVYNSAVYAKRWKPNIQVSIYSAVGTDAISHAMLKQWEEEGIDSVSVQRSTDAHPGIYAISTDEQGERSFIYWRRDSAATQMMRLLGKRYDSIPMSDYVYYSGLSLAILSDNDKAALIELIKSLRKRGAKIAFDPNYRPKMWRDTEHVVHWMEQAYQNCDLAFPGLDDHYALFDHQDHIQIKAYLDQFNISEKVIKCGEDGVYAYGSNNTKTHLAFVPAENQVDSTAAGDSFAGTYLASRLDGCELEQALTNAASIAAFVVQHRGAIIANQQYQLFRETL